MAGIACKTVSGFAVPERAVMSDTGRIRGPKGWQWGAEKTLFI